MENIKVRYAPVSVFGQRQWLLNYGFRKCFHRIQKYVFNSFLSQLSKSEFVKLTSPRPLDLQMLVTVCGYTSTLGEKAFFE